jgi:hypothetical protein
MLTICDINVCNVAFVAINTINVTIVYSANVIVIVVVFVMVVIAMYDEVEVNYTIVFAMFTGIQHLFRGCQLICFFGCHW